MNCCQVKKNNNFKQTEIGLIPKDWEVVRLEDVSEKLKAGGTPKTNVKEYWNGDIPLVKVEDVASSEKYLTKTLFSITREGLESSSAWLVPKNSVLLSMYGTAGEVVINKIAVAVTQNILGIIKNDKITTEFLYYALIFSKNYGMSKITDKTIFKYFTLAKAKGLLFSLPPLPEQQKISFVLSKIQQAIEQQDKIIQSTKELKKSLMNKLFTYGLRGEELKETEIGPMPKSWKVKKINEFAKIKYGKQKPKITGPIPVVGSSGVYARCKDALIDFPTLIIGRKGTAGAVHLFLEPCWPSDTTFYLEWISEEVYPKFLYYYMLTHLLSGEHAKTTMPSLQRQDLEKYAFPFPSKNEQTEIADIIDKVNIKLQQAESRKQTLQSLFKTMLNNLMTGKVRVKNIDFGRGYE